jgi:hypothetical protein
LPASASAPPATTSPAPTPQRPPAHARIKAAVAHTDYSPRGSLAGLGRRQLGRIGFEVPRGEDPAVNPIVNQLLLSLLWSARAADYRLQPFVTGKEPGSRAPTTSSLLVVGLCHVAAGVGSRTSDGRAVG